ncbi:putative DNA repair protein YkoV [Streptomyces sp. YIM 130001]|uniref:non-homologous end joining protein Ku n=1 Tax=Streptomyces sp. YIM 130001 TaxID=2259644 RepID=UPI000E656CC1|nr:Ku protein [Streptomyces sp. YIM 130001]RII15803.1 putative DNA repair protein YkoV [Streptomyces sp. YIM 130001]
MRSIWNGAISFGLVSIPIKLVNATENHSISFRQIHTADGGRIRYRKVCELEEKEVPSAEIGKGYEDADGSILPITDEDLAALPIPTARTIDIVSFVPENSIDPLQMSTAYYLAANGVPAAKPYTLLREALKRSKKVAIAKFALRGRERLGMLRVVDDTIAMHGLLWPDEIRAPESAAPDEHVSVRDAELDLADALMDTLGEVDISTLHDDYREAVEDMLAAKTDGVEPAPAAERRDSGGKVIDLMAALESSVRAAQEARGEGGDAEASGDAADSGETAEVTQLAGRKKTAARKSAPAAPKQVGGKKSTSGAPRKTAAKKTAKSTSSASGSGSKASTSKSAKASTSSAAASGAKASTARSSGAKSTSSKSAAGRSQGAKAAKSTSTAKKTAKKAAPRKRASA